MNKKSAGKKVFKSIKSGSRLPDESTFSPLVTGTRLYLREIRLSDVNERYYRWMNDPEIIQYLESRFQPHSMESLADFVRRLDSKSDEPFFAVCTIDGDEHVGNIKLGPINWHHRRAEVGLIIGEKKYWGKGFATEAIDLVTQYAFENLGLNKLRAGCYEVNEGSARAFEKCGWQREGLLKHDVLIKGRPANSIMIGISAEDYWKKNKL
jgi:RimJ/RimL family protein N-acetyltransferase